MFALRKGSICAPKVRSVYSRPDTALDIVQDSIEFAFALTNLLDPSQGRLGESSSSARSSRGEYGHEDVHMNTCKRHLNGQRISKHSSSATEFSVKPVEKPLKRSFEPASDSPTTRFIRSTFFKTCMLSRIRIAFHLLGEFCSPTIRLLANTSIFCESYE